MSSVRQRLVDKVKLRFQGIRTTAGYLTDIGLRVFLCRPVQPKDDECPALNIWDVDEESKPFLSGIHEHRLKIQVYVYAVGAGVDVYIRQVVADLAQAIGLDRKWDGLAVDTEPGRNTYEIDQETKRLTGAVLYEFTIKYWTPSWNLNETA
jgi:hypothetical protein